MQKVKCNYRKLYAATKQAGRSVLEMIAVIAVSALIVAGIISMGNKVMDDRSTATVVSEVSHIADGAKTLFSWYPNMTGMGSKTLMKYLICQKYVDGNASFNCSTELNDDSKSAKGKLSNGSLIDATYARKLLTNGNTCTEGTAGCHFVITIEVTNLRKAECMALAQTEWGKDFVGMSKASDNSIQYVASSTHVFPLGLTDAVSFCGSKTEGTYSLKILFF